jgi:hypothetical protein
VGVPRPAFNAAGQPQGRKKTQAMSIVELGAYACAALLTMCAVGLYLVKRGSRHE